MLTPANAVGVQRQCQLGHSAGVVRADFNGDGIADLAVGAPNETRTNLTFSGSLSQGFINTPESGAGAVNIIYGSSTGLTATGTQTLDQYLSSVSANAHFGTAMAAGKFGSLDQPFSDLAVAAPGDVKGGAIYVFNGTSCSGCTGGVLAAQPSAIFHGNDFHAVAPGILGNSGPLVFPDKISMAWGDFNGDNIGDLAVEISTSKSTTGISAVLLLFGTPFGLSEANAEVLTVDDAFSPNNGILTRGCPDDLDHVCANSRGHIALAAADFNGDGKHELIIGAPGCNQLNSDGSVIDSLVGCVAIVPGGSPFPNRTFGWGVIFGNHESFGAALAVGDFDGDGRKDLAIGAPATLVNTGIVEIVPKVPGGGIQTRIDTSGAVVFGQNSPGIGGTQNNSSFGAALAANDFNGDGISDLAIGVPMETIGGVAMSGQVNVIYGVSGVGLSTAASANHPATQTFMGASGSGFGTVLSAWNFGKGPEADLAVGVPFFNVPIFRVINLQIQVVGTISGAGGVSVFYGSTPGGLTTAGSQGWTQNSGLNDSAQAGNHFGGGIY
jgi:hypothetical protein